MFIRKPKVTAAQARIKLAIDYLYLESSAEKCTTGTANNSPHVTVAFESLEVSQKVFKQIEEIYDQEIEESEITEEEEIEWNGFKNAGPTTNRLEADNKPGFQLSLAQQEEIYGRALEKAKNIIQKPMEDLLSNAENLSASPCKLSSRGKTYIQKWHSLLFPGSSSIPQKKEATLENMLQFLDEIKKLPMSMDIKIVFMIWYMALLFVVAASVVALTGAAALLGSLTTPLSVLAGVYVAGVSLWSQTYQHERIEDQEYLATIFSSKKRSPVGGMPPNPAYDIGEEEYKGFFNPTFSTRSTQVSH
ncbi:MAG: hypothetical protein K0R24_2443 [Gammaproteobacteria bacterium]|jgi:hypothetical protein|nr:hypothetical protein [Gammaproteobacteria bacterium]